MCAYSIQSPPADKMHAGLCMSVAEGDTNISLSFKSKTDILKTLQPPAHTYKPNSVLRLSNKAFLL